jgi:hypothetical protein
VAAATVVLVAVVVAVAGSSVWAQDLPAPVQPIEQPAKVLEKKEQDLTTAAAVDKMKQLELQVEALKVKAQNLAESLAQANTEASQQKDSYSRMRLQMEALGVAALKGDERSLQTRLLDAANDFRLAEQGKQELTEKLVNLSEAALAYLKSSDAASRERLEIALSQSRQALKKSQDSNTVSPVALGDAKVVSLKSDLGLAVINAGKLSGLRLGMPIKFIRKDRPVADGVIVDCREHLTGILVTTTEPATESVVIGDTIKIEPNK